MHWRHVEGQVVAIDVSSREYLALNRTGACVWPALAEGSTVPDLVRLLIERFEVDEPQATHDVELLIADLRARGLLEP